MTTQDSSAYKVDSLSGVLKLFFKLQRNCVKFIDQKKKEKATSIHNGRRLMCWLLVCFYFFIFPFSHQIVAISACLERMDTHIDNIPYQRKRICMVCMVCMVVG